MKLFSIVTHNGKFHADELMAIALYHKFIDADALIARTRVQKIIDDSDVVIDVGGVYDPDKGLFDHHQFKPGDELYGKSAAGLMYDYVCSKVDDRDRKVLEGIKSKIERIDALDTGTSTNMSANDLNMIVNSYYPVWDSTDTDNNSFDEALLFVSGYLDRLLEASSADLRAAEYVANSEIIGDDEVLVLDRWVPYHSHISDSVQLVVFYDTSSNTWRISTVTDITDGERVTRCPLMKEWYGETGEKLDRIAGMNGCIFCHQAGFIAGAINKGTAIDMALKALVANIRNK